jgi:hypothetical protein
MSHGSRTSESRLKVNRYGFLSFSTKEEEPITVMAKDGWHDGNKVKCFKSYLG